jgi:hypothetical protein
MTCPYGVSGGDGLQIWRATASMLDKQLLAVDRGSPAVRGLGEG